MLKICRGRIIFSINMFGDLVKSLFFKKKDKELIIKKFENNFADYLGVEQAIAVASAKAALYLALKALKTEAGDEIIVPAYTVSEIIDVIVLCKLVPVFVDINLADANIDISLLEKSVSPKTKFILMVHMYGCACQINEIMAISRKYNLKIIEDGAQSCGAEYNGKKIGNFGDIGYFSFGMMKNVNTLGGGMIVTHNPELADFIRKEISEFIPININRVLGKLVTAFLVWVATSPLFFSTCVYPILFFLQDKKNELFKNLFKVKPLGIQDIKKLKVRIHHTQALWGISGIKKLDQVNALHINNARIFNQAFKSENRISFIPEKNKLNNIYSNYVIRIKNRKKLMDHLFKKGIDLSFGFGENCSELERFKIYHVDCPKSKIMEEQNLYLPIYSPLKEKEILRMAKLIKEAL